jgi:hypothetical protein
VRLSFSQVGIKNVTGFDSGVCIFQIGQVYSRTRNRYRVFLRKSLQRLFILSQPNFVMNIKVQSVRNVLFILILLYSQTGYSQTFSTPIPAINPFPGSGGTIGSFTKMMVVNGRPAICYLDQLRTGLYYTRALDADGTAWSPAVTLDIAGNVGMYISFQIVNGYPAVSYTDFTNKAVKFVQATDADGTTWGIPQSIDAGNNKQFTSLQEVNGKPAISWYDATAQSLKYVQALNASGTAWGTPQTLDAGNVGNFSSLLVVNGKPAISYYDAGNQDLKYIRATDADGITWSAPQTVDGATTSVGGFTSLQIVNGVPAIAYSGSGTSMFIRATDVNGMAWGATQTVSSFGGTYQSMQIVNGFPAIAFNVSSGGLGLRYVRALDANGGAWATDQTIDGPGTGLGQFAALQVVNGNPAISYYEATGGNVKFVRAADVNGATWNTPQRLDAKGSSGAAASLQMVNGKPAFSYYNISNRDLEFVRAANATGTAWDEPQTLDGAATEVGGFTSLQIVNGNAAIAYYDATNTSLKYLRATNTDATAWGTSQTLDGASADLMGQYPALQIVNGNPAVAYYDGTNGDLRFIRALDADGTVWATAQILDGAGGDNVGSNLSLQIINGNPAISYYDVTNGRLKFISALDASGTTWGTPVTVDAANNVGQFTSLQIVDGFPAISYYDVTNGNLNFVRATDANGTAWDTPLSIDGAADDVGQFTALQVAGGYPAIAYFDVTNGNLKFVRASNASGSAWTAPVTLHSSETVGQGVSMISNGTGVDIVYYHASELLPYFITADFSTLPVTLTNISAQWKNTAIQLNWQVADESNIERYMVERSADGRQFTKIGTVAAANAVYSHNYSFTDAAPLEGTNYYRLRIEETTGTARYSTIVSLRSNSTTGQQVSVYPNPVKNNVLQFEATLPAGEYRLKMVNSAGVAVMSGIYKHGGGTVVHSLYIPQQITNGVYHMVISNNKLQVTTTFIK